MTNGIKVLTHKKICIINYKLNNISSIIKALNEIGITFDVLENGEELNDYTHIIIPGIGSFEAGVKKLKSQNFYEKLSKIKIKNNVKILGICLGMQLLFEESEESTNKLVSGLSFIKGKVKKMEENISKKIFIPHIGWNKIDKKSGINQFEIDIENDYYFANSYYVEPQDQNVIKYIFKHGKHYPAVIQSGNCYGFQFHPEKSDNGIKIIKHFCSLDL